MTTTEQTRPVSPHPLDVLYALDVAAAQCRLHIRSRVATEPAPARPGDEVAPLLYVTVHVTADKVFGRDGDDLTVTVPVSFHELALGTTLSVPTLEGKVGVRVPKGTADGRILRVRGRGVPKRSGGHGDLLVTVKVSVPSELEGEALEALEAYAAAERASGFDPRAGWGGNRV